jgi:predicted RNase H-like HicB family nuclease
MAKLLCERESDGRWLADIPSLPGVTVYGRTKKQATAAAQALALRLMADRLEHGEAVPGLGPIALKVLGKKSGLMPQDL